MTSNSTPSHDGTTSFECPACGNCITVPAQHGGKRARCKQCNCVLTIPAGNATVAVAAIDPIGPKQPVPPPPPTLAPAARQAWPSRAAVGEKIPMVMKPKDKSSSAHFLSGCLLVGGFVHALTWWWQGKLGSISGFLRWILLLTPAFVVVFWSEHYMSRPLPKLRTLGRIAVLFAVWAITIVAYLFLLTRGCAHNPTVSKGISPAMLEELSGIPLL